MKTFKSKKEVFKYIRNKYANAETILIKGSTAKGRIKQFSDVDVEFYQYRPAKPEYEIISMNHKLILITAYPFKSGKTINKIPNDVLVLKGNYCGQIKNQEGYNKEEKNIRNNQLFLDFLFKYLRTKDKKYLENLDKYSRLK